MAPVRCGIMLFARMGSQRLPGKMLSQFLDRTLFEWMVARARALPWPLVVATSGNHMDDALAAQCVRLGIECFRGPEQDVLARAIACARALEWTGFARLCGDRPLFDTAELQSGLERLRRDSSCGRKVDIYSNAIEGAPVPGMTTEIVRTEALVRIAQDEPTAHEREHVTPRFYARPEIFLRESIGNGHRDLQGHSFAVDTLEDLARIDALLRGVGGTAVDVDVRTALRAAQGLRR